MNCKINPLHSLFLAIAVIILSSLPYPANVSALPTAGAYTTLPSPVIIQPPVSDIPMIATVTIPFQDQFSFTTDSIGRMNHSWYVDNYYLYLQRKSSDDVGHPVAGILFKASRPGLPETIISAAARLVLARPLPLHEAPLLKFYRVNPSSPWSSQSFSGQGCYDPAGHCYNSPADLIDFTNPLVVTGEIRHEEKLNDRSVLYADISKGFSEHNFSAADGIFMELQNDIGGDGSFSVVSFFGKNAPSPALEASLVYFYDPRTQPASPATLAANTCGDAICDPLETCTEDCEVSSDIEPPGLSFTLSPDLQQMDTGTHIVATASRTGENENNNTPGNISHPVISAPVYDASALVDLPGLGTAINPELFDLSKPVAPLSIWVAGFSTTPWNRLLRGTDEDICTYEGSPAPGIYKLCARARDNAGNLSETLCKDFRIGSGTPPEISVSTSPADVRLGETLHVQVSVTEHNEGLSSVTVSLPDNPFTVPLNGDEIWTKDFDIPLCSWTADQPGKLNPINIGVTAIDGEGLDSLYTNSITPKFPLQARYGLGVENFGADLCWDQYAKTFGNGVYASVSVCPFPPFLFPGKCWNKWGCKCYSGTPGSAISGIVNALGGWIMESIVDAIDTHDKLEDYFCVQDLSQLGVPDLFALLFFPVYHISGGPGQCTGFTTAAAMLANHAATPEQICPGCGSKISSWSKDDITFYVGHRQGSVVSAEFIHLLLANFTDSADTVVRKIYDSLLQGKHPGISIIGYPEDTADCTPVGHTMLVDRVRNLGGGIYRVYVYDSNRTDASGDAEVSDSNTTRYTSYCNMKHSPYIDIDTVHDNFIFQFNDPEDNDPVINWTRGNGNCNLHLDFGRLGDSNVNISTPDAVLLHLPFSLLSRDHFTMPLSIEGIITMFVGNAAVRVEDTAGNSIGTDGGQHNGIPGAYLFSLPAAQNGEDGVTLIMMPEDSIFTVQVAGEPDKGHFIDLISPTGTSAFLFAHRASAETFSISPQADGLKMAIGEGQFNGALHLLATQNIPLKDIAGNVDEALAHETVPHTQVYSFIGSFGQHPVSFMIENQGTLTTIANQAQAFKAFALSNANAAGDDKQQPLSTMFKTSSKQISIPAGVHHIAFDLPHRNFAPFLIEPISRLNAAPTEMSAYTLANPAPGPAATMPLTGSEKTNVAIVPKLHIPAELQGKTGNFYALLYWVEGNVWFQFTPTGIEQFSGNLKPFKTATSTQTAEFKMLNTGVDLSDVHGTLDIFTGFATRNDLSDLVYNYYQLILK